jgi:hypothetical protein
MGVKDEFVQFGKNYKESGLLYLLLAFLMLFTDLFLDGFSYKSLVFTGLRGSVFDLLKFNGLFFLGFVVLIVVIILVQRSSKITKEEIPLIVVFSVLFLFIFTFGGQKTWVHLFIPFIMMLSRNDLESSEKLSTLILIYFLDFIVRGLFYSFVPMTELWSTLLNPVVTPFWILNALQYCSSASPGIVKSISEFLLILYFIGLFLFIGYKFIVFNAADGSTAEARKAFFSVIKIGGQSLTNYWLKLRSAIMAPFNTTLYDYGGRQEESQNPQGVFLKEIEKGDMLFFEQTPVLLWAVLEARTLEQPIEAVNVKCTTELEDETIKEGIVNEGSTLFSFPVYSGVDRPLSCRFDGLLEGNYDAKFIADFDFTTESRQLVYLMDRTRYTEELIALKRQGLSTSPVDILSSIDITETNPKSIYTTGPVAVEIGTNGVPWDIGDSNNILYRFGVKIKNEWTNGGKLKSINAIRFIVPATFDFVVNSCSLPVDYNAVNMADGTKAYETTSQLPDIKDEVTINCLMRINKDSLDQKVEVTRRYLKAEVDYTYEVSEKIDFDIEKLNDGLDQHLIDSDTVCCEIGSTSSVISKVECSSRGREVSITECYDECCEVRVSGSSNRYYWVSTATMCDEYDSQSASASIITDKTKCPKK